jgi:hypothetical protein
MLPVPILPVLFQKVKKSVGNFEKHFSCSMRAGIHVEKISETNTNLYGGQKTGTESHKLPMG